MPGGIFQQVTVDATCPAGQRLVGGGVQSSNPGYDIETSFPLNSTTWRAHVTAGEIAPGTVTVHALCAVVP